MNHFCLLCVESLAVISGSNDELMTVLVFISVINQLDDKIFILE